MPRSVPLNRVKLFTAWGASPPGCLEAADRQRTGISGVRMIMKLSACAMALAALLLTTAQSRGQTRAEAGVPWPEAVRDVAAPEQMLRAAAAFPNSAGMQRRRLGFALQTGDREMALDALRRLAAMGAVLSASAQAQAARLVGEREMAPLSQRMAMNARPLAASRIAAEIPAAHHLVEGIIWDEGRHRLYLTTVVDRALLLLGRDGAAAVAARAPASLFGGAYDPVRRLLWIASGQAEPTPRDGPAFAGLVTIDPLHPVEVRPIPAPEGAHATPGDVAVGRDGSVYASDGLNGALYRCRPGCAALEILLPPGTLFSAQGLAFSRDRRLLYIADRRYGLAALEIASGRLLRVRGRAEMMLDGIDGLVAHGRTLIATQTAYAPARIIRLRLSRDGLAVTRLDVLERANPAWGEITLATVAGNRLLYVADAQWERYGEGGIPNPQMPARPTAIRSLALPR